MHRLAKAIADFDAATIETTHGFCLQVLYGLGTAGDVDRDVTLVEDVSDMVDEVVDDLYLRKFAHRETRSASRARMRARSPARLSTSPTPTSCPRCPMATISNRRAAASPSACARRWRSASAPSRSSRTTTSSFVFATLSAIRLGDRWRCARLRERYDVVLVDEFQDTDPVQWDIMSKAFDAEGKTLVLIGDPKQAIYAFRGADVHTYLKAKATVQSKWTLDVNWRSDKGLLAAYDALFQVPSSVRPASPTATSGPPPRTRSLGCSALPSPPRCA